MKYLKEFETTADYATYSADTENFILPNVSVCNDDIYKVYYNRPLPPSDGKVVIIYNVTDASQPTKLYTCYGGFGPLIPISDGGLIPLGPSLDDSEANSDSYTCGSETFDDIEIDGVSVSIESLDAANGLYSLSAGRHEVRYAFKNEEEIAAYIFSGCTSIVSVTIPDTFVTIGNSAFNGCSNLSSLNISGTIESMGYSSFYGCTSLPAENGIIYVQDYLIQVSDATLQTYTIKSTAKVICDSAFEACTNITGITIPDSVTEIRDSAFNGVSTLTDVAIGNGVKSIGMYAFSRCSNISSCTIGNSLEVIDSQAFEMCSGLNEITLPASMKTIGDSVWAYTAGLELTVLATTPPTCGWQIFYSSSCSIYVPSASVDAYKAAEGWSFYDTSIYPIPIE